jgi:hypothetical protein
VTVTVGGSPSASRKTLRFEFLYRQKIVMSAVFIFLMLPFPFSTNNLRNLPAEAQTSLTTTQNDQNADEAIQTFNMNGALGSLVTDLLNPAIGENVSDSPPIYQFT